MSGKRIVVVGGGSHFSAVLAEGFIEFSRDILPGAKVVLLDIHEENLEQAHGYATELAREVGADMSFESTTDQRRAFDGADFIINTFRPGSYEQQEQDETVPPKYGLQGNETVGIGGIFMACRVVPILRQICADAQELCPRAWFLNYTNPTQYVADVVRRITTMPIISLCDGVGDVPNDLAPFLGVEPSDIAVYPAGTNHAVWIMRFTVKGEEGYPLLRERLGRMTEEEIEAMCRPPHDLPYPEDQMYQQFIPRRGFPFDLKLFRIYGLLPAPRYYWRYHMDQDAIVAAQMSGSYMSMAGSFKAHRGPSTDTRLKERLAKAAAQLSDDERTGVDGHIDLGVRVLTAIAGNLGRTLVVNVPNRGAVSNLPEQAIVEVMARVDSAGPHPLAMGPLPKALLGYQQALVLSQELAVDAALSGSRQELLGAILAHPLVHSVDGAEKAMNELLELQAEWLPQFRGRG